MCVKPISAISFRAGKIELDSIHKKDLCNYDRIKLLARQSFCDFLIEKRENPEIGRDCVVYSILARRKWINPNYVFAQEATTVHKNTPLEKIADIIYEATKKAALETREKTYMLAKAFIR